MGLYSNHIGHTRTLLKFKIPYGGDKMSELKPEPRVRCSELECCHTERDNCVSLDETPVICEYFHISKPTKKESYST